MDERGLSLLEILVASAILLIVAWQLSDGVVFNMGARTRIDLQRQVLQVESALRGAAFKKVSELVEGGIDCKKPGPAFAAQWAKQSFREVRLSLTGKMTPERFPQEMLQRCARPTHRSGGVERGFYFCLELKPGTAGDQAFLGRNDVFAEVFYALWDARLDRGVRCQDFNDKKTPVRGAKLFYTIYWRPKDGTAARQDDHFFRHAGVMYGQTRK